MKKVDYDIIMLALPRWDGQYSSTAYSLAQALSQYTRVFYIDNPFTVKDFISQRKSKQIEKRKDALVRGKNIFTIPSTDFPNLVAVTPRLVLPINWLSAGAVYDTLSGINDQILFSSIQKILKEYGVKDFVFINSFNPLFARRFPSWFKPRLTIYHCVDDISKSEYISKHGTRLEAEAVKKADLTLVTSMELKRLKLKESSNVYYHPNAANVELFQQSFFNDVAKPLEMQKIPTGKKSILYMGNICHRLDYELLRKIAEKHSDKYLVMVGPKSNDNYKKAGLDQLPNIIFTGSKQLKELPAFVRYSDCCIIPFLCITLTRSIYPLKINEYLSGGKPVVTTNFSEDIANFAHVAFVSSSHEEFLVNIDRAILEDSKEKAEGRVKYSSSNNWNSRAIQLLEIIGTQNQRHDN
jgi:teichuronic acid biosynthesis glycosyltransferase TuaH